MLVLCGFTASNYYNKVKLALLEKGVAFTEEAVVNGKKSEEVLEATPLGKVPCSVRMNGILPSGDASSTPSLFLPPETSSSVNGTPFSSNASLTLL